MTDKNTSEDSKLPKISEEISVEVLSRNENSMNLPGQPLPYTVRKRFGRLKDKFHKNIDFSKYDSEDLSVIIDSGFEKHNRPNRIDPLKEADRQDSFVEDELPELLQHAEDPDRMLFGRFIFPEKELMLSLEKEDIVKLGIAADEAGVDYFVAPPIIVEGHNIGESEVELYVEALKEIQEETDERMGIIPTMFLGAADQKSGKIFAQEINKLSEERFEFIGGHIRWGNPLVGNKSKDTIVALKNFSDRKLAFVDVPQKFGNISREKAYGMIGGKLILQKRWVYGDGSDEKEMTILSEKGKFKKQKPEEAESPVNEIPLEDNQEDLKKYSSVRSKAERLVNDIAPQVMFEKFRQDLEDAETDKEIWEGREHLQAAVQPYLDQR